MKTTALPFFLLLALSITGCNTFKTQHGDEYLLKPKEAATLPANARLYFDKVVADSRCAPDVQCFWEGVAELKLILRTPDGQEKTFSLFSTDAGANHYQSIVVMGYRITFVQLAPTYDATKAASPVLTVRADLVE
ncbi:MAG: hypothetical protein J0L94_09170 [Rhodothermia bacterium]|nr:hypothetical protein [Rhodothermia bacterium]